jgi:PAS domain S-box-containing protein
MLLNPNSSTAVFGMASRRFTRWLIKASLWGAVAWFGYQLANQIADSPNNLQQSPVTTIAFLALAVTVAAYVALRQRDHLAEQTRSQSERDLGAELEKAGLVGAIEEASDAVVIADGEGTIQYVNPAYTRMTGYTAEEVIGQHARRQRPGMSPAFQEQVRETVRNGNIWRGETANRRKDGTPYAEDITVAPVRDAGGAIRRYISIRRDVTARHAANAATAFLASIVESSEDAIVSSTPEGMVLSWNRGAERLYGYGAEEAVGKPLSMLDPGDQRDNLTWLSGKLQRGESVGQFDGVGLTKAGKRVDISISACPIRNADGQITAHAAIMRDITAQVQSQEARALLASIVDSAEDAILGAAPDGTILSWNRAAERLYGYRADEVLGKPLAMLLPAGSQGEASQLPERIGRGETISQWETVTANRDGGKVEISLTMSPVRNALGTVVGSSLIARDIGRRRRDRESLRQRQTTENDGLPHEVRGRQTTENDGLPHEVRGRQTTENDGLPH